MRNDKVEQVYEKLEKQINHQPLSELFGLVAVTNAEKVILERIQEKQGQIKEYLKNIMAEIALIIRRSEWIDIEKVGVRYMEQLLIVEDDIGLNQGLCKALKADARQIISCQDLKTAKEQLLCGGVSLILLDINLPDGSGLELLREIKENMPGIPVILLTANDTDLDIVDGLERGADDYITKPFSLSVLRARVNTQLRKQASNHKNAPFHIDLFHFDFEAMTFYVGDSKVELSKTEQKLLRLLVENRGRTMTRGDLVDRIWTDGAEYVDENALSVTIKRLRDKLGAQKYIKTVYGIGYSWVTKDE